MPSKRQRQQQRQQQPLQPQQQQPQQRQQTPPQQPQQQHAERATSARKALDHAAPGRGASATARPGRPQAAAPAAARSTLEFTTATVHGILAGADVVRQRQHAEAVEGAKAEVQAARRALHAAKQEVAVSQGEATAAAEAEAEAKRAHTASAKASRAAAEQEAALRRRAAEWLASCGDDGLMRDEVDAATAHATALRDACADAKAKLQASAASMAAAQGQLVAARTSLAAASKRLEASGKRAAVAEQVALQPLGEHRGGGGAAKGSAPKTGAALPNPHPHGPTADGGARGLEAEVQLLVKAAGVGCLAWRDAEIQVLVDRREQRRAEIYALNRMLQAALTGSEPDP